MSTIPLLSVEKLSKHFSGIPALREASLELLPGEIHALAGENGAGKSTLINILSGLLQADSGRLVFDGAEIPSHSPANARKLGITVIYQDFDLAPNLSVADNILLGQESTNHLGFLRRSESRRRAMSALQRAGLDIDPGRPVSTLNVAQRQLVAIARALSRQTRLLVMDEPSSALAANDIDHLLNLVMELKEDGITVLFISHKLDEIFGIADRITVLRDGQTVACRPARLSSRQEVISLMVGREPGDLSFKRLASPGEVVLEVRGLGKPGLFHDIDFSLRSGEVLGFYGLKGAGRTALAECLFGLGAPDAGSVRMEGRQVDLDSCTSAIGHGIGMVPEDRKGLGLFPNMDVLENLSIAALDRISAAGLIRPGPERVMAEAFISKLNIRTRGLRQNIANLSGGNQQKVLLARWLANRPAVLILDEPTAGIDVGAKEEIYGVMANLVENGMGIILISSELPELLAQSDRILVMQDGRITAEMAAAEASEERVMQAIHA